MPVIPNDRLGNVGLRPVGGGGLNRVGTGPALFGGVEAAALQDGARAVAQVGNATVDLLDERARAKARVQEERDTLDVLNAMNTAELEVGEYLRGATAKKLQDARGVADATSAWLDEYGTKKKMGMSPAAQAAFTQRFANTVTDALNRTAEHEGRELQAEKDALVKNSRAALLDRVAANYGDELARRRALNEYEQALLVGVGNADERARLKAEFTSEAHLAVVDRMAVDNPEAALAYFNQNADAIAGTEHAGVLKKFDGMKKVLEERAGAGRVFRLADEALQQPGSLFEQEEWIRAQVRAGDLDEMVADKAVGELRDRYAAIERSNTIESRKALEQARRMVFDGADPEKLPPSLQAELVDSGKWDSLVGFAEKRRKGEEPVTDRVLYWGLQNMAVGVDSSEPGAPANPELVARFKDLDIEQMVVEGRLSPADADELQKLQVKLREGKLTDKERRSIRTPLAVMNSLMPKGASIEAQNLIAERFHDAVQNYKDRNDGAEPDEAELSRIATGIAFNPPEKNIPEYSANTRADVMAGLMQMPEVGGRALPADVFGTMGRALKASGRRGSADEVKALAEAIAAAGRDPGVPYTERQYAEMIAAMGLVD